MNYKQTIDFLYAQLPMYQRQGKAAYKANLDNTLALCAGIGNPEKGVKTIHIAGTNGKGSTAHFIASVLQEAGFNTGLYTSPHLLDFRERIRINGEMIGKDTVVCFVADYGKAVAQIQPSFFEWSFAMAMHYFNAQKVDIAVIETGLGGRLDSTNVISPLISVITNIGMDHTQFLGNTPEQIAAEKAGIIKRGVPVIIGETQSRISGIFIRKSKSERAPIFFADKFDAFPIVGKTAIGDYQMKNIQTAWCTLNQLPAPFVESVKPGDFIRGVSRVHENTGLRGRWEVLSEHPLTIADTAHNAEGLQLTMRQLQALDKDNMHIVFGMVDDKNPEKVLAMLPRNASYYLCQASIPRAMKLADLAAHFSKSNLKFKTFAGVSEAVQQAIRNAKKEDVVYIGGSTFVVAEALEKHPV